MSTTTPADRTLSPAAIRPARPAPPRLRPLDILILSAWCGLAGGLLEVAARVVSKRLLASNHLYLMSRHFVWLVPLSNLMLFVVLGVILTIAAMIWRRSGRWLGPRLILFLTMLPVLIVLGPWIYQSAWMLFALGAALRLAPILERHATTGLRGRLLISFPALLGVALLLFGWRVGGQWLAERREDGRPMPAGNPPNVILITLDTVRADHLSLYGYSRPTSPVLEGLARSGIRFDEALGGPLDPPLARDHVYRPMAPRAERQLDDPARHHGPHPGRAPRVAGLHDGRIRGQYHLVLLRYRARSRLYPLR